MAQLSDSFPYVLVDDQVVIDVVKKKIGDYEKENKNWILEGFPRTKVQALSFEKLGIIPDKIIQIKCNPDKSLLKLKQNLHEQDLNLLGEVLTNAAKNALEEFQLFHKGVEEVFKDFLFTIDSRIQSKQQIEQNLNRMLKIKFSAKSPRKPPQIIILGPPGSGRSSQARLLAQQLGLVKVSVFELLKE